MNLRKLMFLCSIFLCATHICSSLKEEDVSRELNHGSREISVQRTQWGLDILKKISSKVPGCDEPYSCSCVFYPDGEPDCCVNFCPEVINVNAGVDCPADCFALCDTEIEGQYSWHCFHCPFELSPPPPPPHPPPPPSGGGADCFPSTGKVFLENGKSANISELQVGDRVQTVSSEGSLKYGAVTAFLKKRHTVTTLYKSLTTSMNNTFSVTGNHLIYARKSFTEKFIPLFADHVQIGHEVLVKESFQLISAKVVNVSNILMQGTYVPLTLEGNIMVDGILASCYPSADHDMSHIVLVAIQWYPEVVDWIFGDDSGLQVYVKILEHVGRSIMPHASIKLF